jgi:hypothetical protein
MIKGSVEKGCPFKLIQAVVVVVVIEFSRVPSELRAKCVRSASIATKPLCSENTTWCWMSNILRSKQPYQKEIALRERKSIKR